MHNKTLIALVLTGTCQAATALTFQFDFVSYAGGTSFSPDFQNAVQSAGNWLGSRIQDDLLPITSTGTDSFKAGFKDPSNPALFQSINRFNVAADTLMVFVGSADLGGSTLARSDPGDISSISGSTSFVDNAISRGESGISDGSGSFLTTQSDFAPWGGTISFNSNLDSTWHTSMAEPGSGNDLFSAALHELTHVMGFGTSNSWDSQRSGLSFNGPASTDAPKSLSGSPIPAGDPVPLADTFHWRSGISSIFSAAGQEAAMDPELTRGTRKYLTELDLSALEDIGWEISADASVVPLPPAILLLGSAIGLLTLRKRR